MEYKRIKVKASGQYEIIIGDGLIGNSADYIKEVTKAQNFAVITDDTVDSLYGEKVCGSLSAAGFNVCKFVFPHGEASKCSDTLLKIYSFLCQNHYVNLEIFLASRIGDLFFLMDYHYHLTLLIRLNYK